MRYEMRLKFKESLLGVFLLVLGLSQFGCIEEPAIEAIKRPFSEIRIVNLSNNVDGMRVLIDDVQIATLAITGATGYFDINSGKKVFKIFNSSNDLVFEKELTINSYDRATIVFAGFFSTDLLLNTFSNFEVFEGEVLQSSEPDAGMLNVYVVNASSPVDTTESREYIVHANIIPTGGTAVDTTYRNGTDTTVVFGGTFSIGDALPGEYTFQFTTDGAPATVSTPPLTLSAGFRYYLFIYGHPNNVQFFNNEVVPQPRRNK
jgi:hypothetical protein